MLYGFLNINKPRGITSFGIIKILRRILYGQKIGHLGTLDPMASGVLILALNEATKLVEFVNSCDKEYEADILLGTVSNTYDAEGELKKISDKKPLLKDVKIVLKGFKGEIMQVPPAYSAVKIKGKRAYELARKGKEVEIKPRKIKIYSLKMISYKYPVLKIKVECSSGTYIRSLADDIGKSLKTGAYLNGLKRTKVGNFDINDSNDIKDLETVEKISKYIVPVEKVIKIFPDIRLNDTELKKLNFGQTILRDNLKDHIDLFRGFHKNALVGILERVPGSKNHLKYYKKLNID